MTYSIDLDGTLVTDCKGNYSQVKPIIKVIEKVRNLYNTGNTIIIDTARGKAYKELTKQQLEKFNIPYHILRVGKKPSANIYIDDKALNVKDWMNETI